MKARITGDVILDIHGVGNDDLLTFPWRDVLREAIANALHRACGEIYPEASNISVGLSLQTASVSRDEEG